jgi:hypothetical protein
MDDESKQLLREIRDLQKAQLELFRPWLQHQFRFSLRALLIALTFAAIFLGIMAFLNSSRMNTSRTTTVAPIPVTKK